MKITQDNIDGAVNALAGLDSFAARTAELAGVAPDESVLADFRVAKDDDLDTPRATALLFDTVRRANAALDAGSNDAASLAAAAHVIATTFGLDLALASEVDSEARGLAQSLDDARSAKDFATADALRARLQADGWTVETTRDGTSVRG